MEFQIRDETFGLALKEAENATEALLDFLADRERGALRRLVRQEDDGGASVVVNGIRYYAVAARELRDPTEVELAEEPVEALQAMADGEVRTTPRGRAMAARELEARARR
jgi:hypothetical protein